MKENSKATNIRPLYAGINDYMNVFQTRSNSERIILEHIQPRFLVDEGSFSEIHNVEQKTSKITRMNGNHRGAMGVYP